MDSQSLRQEAQKAADLEAPPPPYDPIQAGGLTAVAAVLVMVSFAGFAGFDLEKFGPAVSWTTALAFAVVWYPLRRQQKANSAAFAKHLERLKTDAVSSHSR